MARIVGNGARISTETTGNRVHLQVTSVVTLGPYSPTDKFPAMHVSLGYNKQEEQGL